MTEKEDMADNNFNKKKYITVMIGIAAIIIGLVYFNGELKQGQTQQFLDLNNTVTKIDVKQNTTNLKVDIGFKTLAGNQKILGAGINDLGNILIGNVSEIDAKTDLIPDIKFQVDRIISQPAPTVLNATVNGTQIVGNISG